MKSFDLEEKLRYLKSTRGTRYIFGLLVLAAIVAAVLHFRFQASYGIDFQEQQMVISGPGGTEPISADYRSIRSVTLLDSYTAKKAVSGAASGSQNALHYGRYTNDAYGEYFLCAVPSIPVAIEIRTDSDVIVFNYESPEVTAALSQAILDLVAQKQQ